MGHSIAAVIGHPDAVIELVETAGCPAPTPLSFGLMIAPLGYQQIDQITQLNPGDYVKGFRVLSSAMERQLAKVSRRGPIALIETNYFGGAGSQAAACFSDGHLTYKASTEVGRSPATSDNPINAVLRTLGVSATESEDEFDVIGLRKFRDLESLGLDEWEED